MDFVQIGGSLFAIVILAFIARWLFPTKSELTAERVLRNVARYCPDTDPDIDADQLFLGDDKKNAIWVFANNQSGIATATALGDRVVVRHFPDVGQLTFSSVNGKLRLNSDDYTQPTFLLALDPTQIKHLLSVINSSVVDAGDPAHA